MKVSVTFVIIVTVCVLAGRVSCCIYKHTFRAMFCVKAGSGSGVAFDQDFKSEVSELVMVMLIPVPKKEEGSDKLARILRTE